MVDWGVAQSQTVPIDFKTNSRDSAFVVARSHFLAIFEDNQSPQTGARSPNDRLLKSGAARTATTANGTLHIARGCNDTVTN